MKQTTTFLGLVGACAACCAVPLVLPLLGAGAVGAAWLSPELALGLAAAVVVAGVAIGISRQKKAKAANGACGCSGAAKANR